MVILSILFGIAMFIIGLIAGGICVIKNKAEILASSMKEIFDELETDEEILKAVEKIKSYKSR